MKDLTNNHSNSAIPDSETVGVIRISQVFIGVAITIPAFLAGAEIMLALGATRGAIAIVSAGVVLALIGSLTMYLGARTRLSTYKIIQTAFGIKGANFVNGFMSIVVLGWFAVTVTLFGATLNQTLNAIWEVTLPETLCVILGGLLMVVTAIFGFRSIDLLSRIAVPLLLIMLLTALYLVLSRYGVTGLIDTPNNSGTSATTLGVGISMAVGGLMMGVTIAPDYARFAKHPMDGPKAAMLSFILGNSLVLVCAGLPSIVTGDKSITATLIEIGLGIPALLVIIFATWTTNIANLYSSSLAMAQIVPSVKDATLTVCLGALGTCLALSGIMDNLISFLVFLGVAVPPIAGIYLTHYLFESLSSSMPAASDHGGVRYESFINWALGTLIAYLGLQGIIRITGIPSVDAIVIASGGYLLTRYAAVRLNS